MIMSKTKKPSRMTSTVQFINSYHMIHWCENKSRDEFKDVLTGKLDTLYKVRPLLTVIQQNLGRFIKPCTNLSLDETCIAIRSKFARQMTFYKSQQTRRKTSFKILYIVRK